MDNIKAFVELLAGSDCQEAAMDTCHYLQIVGSLVAKKTDNILEVGIGTAMLTTGLVMGMRYNQCGRLPCVDNWRDWHGIEPPEIATLREAGVMVIAPVEERVFLASSETDTYDFVVSDGDHSNSGTWVDEYFRITKPEGFIYFHNTNNHKMFPTLALVQQRVLQLGLPHYHFTQSSRKDERCERGLLFVVNRKQ